VQDLPQQPSLRSKPPMAGSQVRQVWVTHVTLPSPLAVVYRSR
jgi:hypothetical protein